MLSNDISVLDRKQKEELESEQNFRAPQCKYNIESKVLKSVIDGVIQRLVANNAKILR